MAWPALIDDIALAEFPGAPFPATIVTSASALVRAYCGWHIAPVIDEQFTIDGSGAWVQPLPTQKIVDVLTLTENGTTVEVDTYGWSQAGFLVRRDQQVGSESLVAWTDRVRGIEVQLRHGYEAVPAEVTAIIAALSHRTTSITPGVRQESVGSVSVSYAVETTVNGGGGGALTVSEQQILARYRLPARAGWPYPS